MPSKRGHMPQLPCLWLPPMCVVTVILIRAAFISAQWWLFFLYVSVFYCFFIHFLQPTAEALRGAIQLGIGYTVGNLTSKPDRDVLMQDFYVVESVFLPRYSIKVHVPSFTLDRCNVWLPFTHYSNTEIQWPCSKCQQFCCILI